MTYEELNNKVVKWGEAKGILSKSTPLKQLEKTQEELDETKHALEKLAQLDEDVEKNQNLFPEDTEKYRQAIIDEVEDGIGDMEVTISLLKEMLKFDTTQCFESAYNVISKRTGKMVNGLFVKDK